jgi:hypothetical protein
MYHSEDEKEEEIQCIVFDGFFACCTPVRALLMPTVRGKRESSNIGIRYT